MVSVPVHSNGAAFGLTVSIFVQAEISTATARVRILIQRPVPAPQDFFAGRASDSRSRWLSPCWSRSPGVQDPFRRLRTGVVRHERALGLPVGQRSGSSRSVPTVGTMHVAVCIEQDQRVVGDDLGSATERRRSRSRRSRALRQTFMVVLRRRYDH